MKEVGYARALVIPDIHHDTDWASEVIAHERGNFDGIIFLGDYFDTYFKDKTGPKGVCKFLDGCNDTFPCTFLVGNHDAQYLYERRHGSGSRPSYFTDAMSRNPLYCSGYSRSRSEEIARHLSVDVAARMQPFVLCQGHVLSHAGINPRLLRALPGDGPDGSGDLAALRYLHEDFTEALRTMNPTSPLFWCGSSRGGNDPFSGPLWADWNDEFEDSLPWPQIVGHTARRKTMNPIGRSVCLDNGQRTYGVLEGGVLRIGAVIRNKKGEVAYAGPADLND